MSVKGIGNVSEWPQPTDSFAARFQERARNLEKIGCLATDAHAMLADDLVAEVNSVLRSKGKEAAADLVISVLENILEHEDTHFYSRQLFVACLEKINRDSRGLLSTDVGDRMLTYLYNHQNIGTERERSLLKRGVKTLVGHGFFDKIGVERYLNAHREEMNRIDESTHNVQRVRRYMKFYHDEVEGIEISANAHRRLDELQRKVHAVAEEPLMPYQKSAIPPEAKTVRKPPASTSQKPRMVPDAPPQRERVESDKTVTAPPPAGFDPAHMPPFLVFFQEYRRRRAAYMEFSKIINQSSNEPSPPLLERLSELRHSFEELRPLFKNYSSREIRDICREEYRNASPERQKRIDNMIHDIEVHNHNGAVYGILNVFSNEDEPYFEALFFSVADFYPKSVAEPGIEAMKQAARSVDKKY